MVVLALRPVFDRKGSYQGTAFSRAAQAPLRLPPRALAREGELISAEPRSGDKGNADGFYSAGACNRCHFGSI